MKARFWGPLAPLTLGLAVVVFGVDQLHKYWMLDVYGIIEKAPVRITSFFDLVMVWNTGVSYGLFSTHLQEWLVALTLAIVILLWIWACGASRAIAAAALGMVIGGALGNASDRLTRGAVADFFHFHYQSFSWYVFNVADIAIVVGVALLMYESVVIGDRGNRRGKA
ncbi:signal peptidase II [Aestuariivirga sp.]|uniref:signal peptidase II n=1 Tax=Aestuariivirga sp. TaxID=2650926 RepID=UPI0025BD0E5A|nr:signal peptidase II [Aestuariivirga sp.]MCA3555420.1 signal peptidase II [Aestuariivirga sp.]